MGEAFDILNLIFLALAVVVFLRLRSVLGRRTGHERPPSDPYSAPKPIKRGSIGETGNDNDGRDDKVVPLPGRLGRGAREASSQDAINRIAPAGSALAQALTSISLADRSFEPQEFLAGARGAYELIVNAFAHGDRKTLRPLLGADVYESFESVIRERDEAGQKVELNFIGILSADIVEASLNNRIAEVTVKFVSELTRCVKNSEGAVIEGDPTRVQKVTDVWTFQRDTRSSDPNWQLTATDAGE